jgi:multiple sugar transport system ATP-binding protein
MMGTRIGVMKAGKVAQIGVPLDVYWNPADTFVARFLGSPPMNLGNAVVTAAGGGHLAKSAGIDTPLTRWSQAELGKLSDQPITVGVRAEDLHTDKATIEGGQCGHVRGRAISVEPPEESYFISFSASVPHEPPRQ